MERKVNRQETLIISNVNKNTIFHNIIILELIIYKMSEFYSKYRHLFEEGASDFSHFKNGYD